MAKIYIIVFLFIANSAISENNQLECASVADPLDRLECYDRVEIKKTKKSEIPEIIQVAREKVKNYLKDPFSARFRNEKIIDDYVCGEVNGKGGGGGYMGFRQFYSSSRGIFRLGTIDNFIHPELWNMNCNNDVDKEKIGDWTKYYNKNASVFSIDNDESTLFLRCSNGKPQMLQDLSEDVVSEQTRGFLGQGPLVETHTTTLYINGHNSRWKMYDKDTIVFIMTGRNMKHIANLLKSDKTTINIGGQQYSSNGLKESLRYIKKLCPNKYWKKHIGDLL